MVIVAVVRIVLMMGIMMIIMKCHCDSDYRNCRDNIGSNYSGKIMSMIMKMAVMLAILTIMIIQWRETA